jgi:hypothetical protein
MYVIYSTLLHQFICHPPPPPDSNVSEDAGIEPSTVATSHWRRSGHSATSHPQYIYQFKFAIHTRMGHFEVDLTCIFVARAARRKQLSTFIFVFRKVGRLVIICFFVTFSDGKR